VNPEDGGGYQFARIPDGTKRKPGMGSYETTIDTLAGELARVEAAFRGLTGPEWAASTLLVPVDPDLPHWTVLELAGHFDISIGLTRMLIDGRGDLQPARDRTSFFINPRSDSARPSRSAARCQPIPSGRATSRPCGWTSSRPAASSRPWSTAWT
jgi:hypothetical protein